MRFASVFSAVCEASLTSHFGKRISSFNGHLNVSEPFSTNANVAKTGSSDRMMWVFFNLPLCKTANLKAIIGNLSDKKVSVNIQVSLNCPMTLCHRGECRGQKARG